jgi:hypothetical protein
MGGRPEHGMQPLAALYLLSAKPVESCFITIDCGHASTPLTANLCAAAYSKASVCFVIQTGRAPLGCFLNPKA